MASVQITISGVLYDKYSRTGRPVTIIGDASLTGIGIGGGPIIPPDTGEKPPLPPDWGIWPGPGDPDFPGGPGKPPPGMGPGGPWRPEHPIVLPPDQVPPGLQPPTPPAPGSPTTPVPPPAGSAGWPVTPMVPPAYLVLNYPGIGPVVVAPPVMPRSGEPAKKA